jgi:hypothetical protein
MGDGGQRGTRFAYRENRNCLLRTDWLLGLSCVPIEQNRIVSYDASEVSICPEAAFITVVTQCNLRDIDNKLAASRCIDLFCEPDIST